MRVLEGLDDWERSRFRSLDRLQLRGRAEPVHVHLQEPARRFGDTAATAYGDMLAPAPEPEGIRLIWLDVNRIYAGTSLPVVLGRSPQATYIIDDTRVSRSHARIDWHGGTFQLVDLSYNGTYVRFDHDPEIISLRRGACTLHGSGVIGLGTPPIDPVSPCVRFEVLRFADTQRHVLPDRRIPVDDVSRPSRATRTARAPTTAVAALQPRHARRADAGGAAPLPAPSSSSDPRVVEIPRALWLPLLHGVILRDAPGALGAQVRLDLDARRARR